MHSVAYSDPFRSFNDSFILHRKGFSPLWFNINVATIIMNVWIRLNMHVCVCSLGHGVLPDAVRARGGDPIQAGAREEGHH